MTVELRPFGVACNLSCHYCYQNPQRDAGNITHRYDMDLMKAAIEREGGPFTLFGGEALLLPLDDLEELLRWGLKKYGNNSIQTNGVLINDEHMRMFRQYNVNVGVSIDGPGELNGLRRNGGAARTLESTNRTLANISRLCREHRPPGLIVTLHRVNASAKRLPQLLDWARSMDELGIRTMRLHLLEVESEAVRQYCLSDEENVTALLRFARMQPQLKRLRFDVLEEMERGLLGRDGQSSCVWHACDPYWTSAVRGVEGNGQTSNCGRTNKDGIDFVKADRTGYERYIALYRTPQEEGGCSGCRFFLMCKGQCPGTAIDGDWRNRSELCGVWKRLFSHLEERLLNAGQLPLSAHPQRQQLERKMVRKWERGHNSSIEALIAGEGWDGAEGSAAAFKLRLTLPVRHAYVGAAQQEVWQPRIAAVRSALAKLGVLAVSHKLVTVARIVSARSEVFALHNFAASFGLHSRMLPKVDKEVTVPMMVGSAESLAAYEGDESAASERAADGVPDCCWKMLQPGAAEAEEEPDVWRAALQSGTFNRDDSGAAVIELDDAAPALNTLLAGLGIGLLGYQPCSFHCERSRELAEAKLALGRSCGLREEMNWLEEILAWPVEWTALHGIAEVKTGIVKFTFAAPYTASKLTIRCKGRKKAQDAARGLSFAYKP
ncbi:radical SAM protein [Paenibacillus tarimensis]